MLVSPFYNTAPEHASERAMASYALLDSLHIPYQRIEHEKAETMEVCAAVSDALGVRICKNLFLCATFMQFFSCQIVLNIHIITKGNQHTMILIPDRISEGT